MRVDLHSEIRSLESWEAALIGIAQISALNLNLIAQFLGREYAFADKERRQRVEFCAQAHAQFAMVAHCVALGIALRPRTQLPAGKDRSPFAETLDPVDLLATVRFVVHGVGSGVSTGISMRRIRSTASIVAARSPIS